MEFNVYDRETGERLHEKYALTSDGELKRYNEATGEYHLCERGKYFIQIFVGHDCPTINY